MADEKPKHSRVASALSGSDKPKKKSAKKKKKKSTARPHRVELTHAASGGYIARHHFKPEGPTGVAPEMEEHAIPDIEGLHNHIDEHMGEAPEPEPEPAPAAGGGAAAPPAGM